MLRETFVRFCCYIIIELNFGGKWGCVVKVFVTENFRTKYSCIKTSELLGARLRIVVGITRIP